MHLLARFSRAYDALFGLLENGALMIAFRIDEHISVLRKLHQKLGQTDVARRRMYCIVMMSARSPGLSVIDPRRTRTVDGAEFTHPAGGELELLRVRAFSAPRAAASAEEATNPALAFLSPRR
jgi:hypothetical protein